MAPRPSMTQHYSGVTERCWKGTFMRGSPPSHPARLLKLGRPELYFGTWTPRKAGSRQRPASLRANLSHLALRRTCAMFDLTPLYRSTVGFDRLAQMLDNVGSFETPAYPPYNIERLGEDRYRITMAVAGFSP